MYNKVIMYKYEYRGLVVVVRIFKCAIRIINVQFQYP